METITYTYRDGNRYANGELAWPIGGVLKPRKDLPLLIMSCSDTKIATPPGVFRRPIDVYDGPAWRQVKKAGFPQENIAVISAQYGFLQPGIPIQSYDKRMTEEMAKHLILYGCNISWLADTIDLTPAAFFVGGTLYRWIVEATATRFPDIAPKITYATGSYLNQRAELGRWLRANTPKGSLL